MRTLSALTLLVVLGTSPAWARGQSLNNGPIILELPASTRALGLGNAFVMAGGDHDAIFFTPALVARASGAGIGVQRYGSGGTLGTISGARAWSGGGLAFGAQVLGFGATSSDAATVSADEAGLLRSGSFGASELVASVAHGRSIKGFQAGVAGKLIEQRLGGTRDVTLAADLGVATDLGEVTVGLAAQNLGPGLDIGASSLPLPTRLTLGASLQSQQVGPLDVVATAAVARRRDGEIVPAGGVELAYWPLRGRTFIARVGLRRVPNGGASPVSFGAAFIGDAITLEYGYQQLDGPGAAHRVGFRWR